MRYWTAILLVVGCALAGCGGLAPDQQQTWDGFLAEHLTPNADRVAPIDAATMSRWASAVAGIGDPIVPYIEEQLGKAYEQADGKNDEWLVVMLARIGTPRARQAITKVLAHDYPGAVGPDRLVAAKALVWLGVDDAAPALESAIADHERRIRERGQAGRLEDEVNGLKRALEQLREGRGRYGVGGGMFSLDETT